jgi:hypothetical protein
MHRLGSDAGVVKQRSYRSEHREFRKGLEPKQMSLKTNFMAFLLLLGISFFFGRLIWTMAME